MPTERNVIGVACRFYDPHGIPSPHRSLKALFQWACQLMLKWDDLLPPDLLPTGRYSLTTCKAHHQYLSLGTTLMGNQHHHHVLWEESAMPQSWYMQQLFTSPLTAMMHTTLCLWPAKQELLCWSYRLSLASSSLLHSCLANWWQLSLMPLNLDYSYIHHITTVIPKLCFIGSSEIKENGSRLYKTV